MIQKRFRLTHDEVLLVLKKGKTERTSLFTLRYKTNSHSFDRFSIIVSKKIHAKAVKRNLIRRRIYEAIRKNKLLRNSSKKWFDVVLIPRKNIIDIMYKDIEKAIIHIFSLLNTWAKD